MNTATHLLLRGTLTLIISLASLMPLGIALGQSAPAASSPSISAVPNQRTVRDRPSNLIQFIVTPVANSSANDLKLTVASLNTTVVPDANLFLGGSGTNRNLLIIPAANQIGDATIIITALDGAGKTATASFVLTVGASGTPPIISPIPNQTAVRDQPTRPIRFTITDAETPSDLLSVAAQSSNQILVPNGNILLGSGGSERVILVTPATNQAGIATITLTVTDAEGLSASSTFAFAVGLAATLPAISNIPDRTTLRNQSTGVIPSTAVDAETSPELLTLSGSSSNKALVPDANIFFGGAGANRTVLITPADNQLGTTTITVTVHDADGKTRAIAFC
ncbi:MAG: hypothetical protein FJ403_15340 [Verrucomicrobia bacterium]|nr:hypothetical protein [Verrucomicrobiota bacterium]